MSSPGPRIAIVGSGALATLFAARLGRAQAVEVGGSWTAALDALRRPGARVDDEPPVPVAAGPLASVGPADFVLVLVKAAQTPSVASAAARIAAALGVVVTLQNGLGLREVLEGAVGRGRVAAGVTDLGATLVAPGHVRAFPGHIVLEQRPDLATLVAALSTSGLPTETTSDLRPHAWRKLAVNCALNPLTALFGIDNGAVLDDPARRLLVETAAREVRAVALAAGVNLPDPVQDALAVAQRTAANRSSMRQDLERQAATEIEFLNGAVVREGLRLGVPTPVNAWLANQVRERERTAATLP